MKDGNYIVIQRWMISRLNLKGNELIAYAVIYGFSQDGISEFNGSVSYLMGWMNASRKTVFNTLGSLLERNLIIKKERMMNGMKLVSYSANHEVFQAIEDASVNFTRGVKKSYTGSEESTQEVVQDLHSGGVKVTPNNIVDNIERDNIDISHKSDNTNKSEHAPYEEIISRYNRTCTNLPKVSKLTETRKKAIDKAWKVFHDDLYKEFEIANANGFLIGRNRNGWKADFDFLMRPDKAAKVLEGSYSSDDAKPQQKRDFTGQYDNDDFEELRW